jgi:hypothetical protein
MSFSSRNGRLAWNPVVHRIVSYKCWVLSVKVTALPSIWLDPGHHSDPAVLNPVERQVVDDRLALGERGVLGLRHTRVVLPLADGDLRQEPGDQVLVGGENSARNSTC